MCTSWFPIWKRDNNNKREDYKIQFSKEFLDRTKYSVTYNTIKVITSETLRLPGKAPYPLKELLISHRNKFITKFWPFNIKNLNIFRRIYK